MYSWKITCADSSFYFGSFVKSLEENGKMKKMLNYSIEWYEFDFTL